MRMRHAAVVAGLALGLMSGTAKASIMIDIDQGNGNVALTGQGSIDLSSFQLLQTVGLTPGVQGNNKAYVAAGSFRAGVELYQTTTDGPSSIGPGTILHSPTSSTGDDFGFSVGNTTFQIFVPAGYQSGSFLKFSSLYANSSLSDLGLAVGAYNYNFINGENVDSISLNVGLSPVPLPASAPMFGAALLALGAVGYGVKRKKAAAAA